MAPRLPTRVNGAEGNSRELPFLAVWLSLIAQLALLSALSLLIHFAENRFPIQLNEESRRSVAALLVLLPVVFWLLLAYLPHSRRDRPIRGLLLIFVLCFLAARGVALPFVETVLQPERWLPVADSVTRLLGYALTIGFVQEITRYFAIRYTVWGRGFFSRSAVISYCFAGAVASAAALNLDYILTSQATIGSAALAVLEGQCLQVAGAILLAYGLCEVRIGGAHPIVLVISVLTASLFVGVLITARAGAVAASFVPMTSSAQLLRGTFLICFSVGVLIVLVILLIRRADRKPVSLIETTRSGNIDA